MLHDGISTDPDHQLFEAVKKCRADVVEIKSTTRKSAGKIQFDRCDEHRTCHRALDHAKFAARIDVIQLRWKFRGSGVSL